MQWQNQGTRRALRGALLRLVATSIVMVFTALAGHSQTFRGAINGTVTDPSGAVIVNAQVKATETATGIEHNTVTTSDGQFSFQDIPLGIYKVTVTAQGFPAYTVDKVEVVAGTIYTLPVKLAMQQQATTVEVSAAALTLDTTTQTQNTTISTQIVQDIPLNGRDFTQLIATAPGYSGYSVGGYGSLNGTRPNQMNWQIDGVDNNDFWHNIPAVNQGGVSGIAGTVMPIDAVDEFSAQTQSGAEAGRNAGGTVNLVLKSGGNTIHGSAYYYWRNEYFSDPSPFYAPDPAEGVTKPPRLRNENYGFTVGGPILKDKFFYFLGFEKQQYIIGLSGIATEPSTAWVNNALALLNTYGVQPSTISENMLGALCAACPNPSSTQGLWPTSGASSIVNLPATPSNFFAASPSTGYSYNGVVKLDYNFSEKQHLSARMFNGQGSQTAPLGTSTALAVASSNLPYYFERAPIHVQNYTLVLNSAYTPTLTNQILFGVNYFNQTFRDANASFNTVAMGLDQSPDALINGKPILGAPNIAIVPPEGGGFEQVGITPPEGRNDITGMLADIVSYNRGKHQFRFGGEMRQGHVNEFYYRDSLGEFVFDGTQGPWAGTCSATDVTCQDTLALADFLAGDVSTSNVAVGDAERTVTVNGLSFFGSDQWQVTRKLNINLGLRWEYFGPLHNDSKDLAVFVPGQGLVVQGNGISSIFPPDKNNLAPRFGFAYQPFSKGDLVVRGGFGVFYDQINMNPFLDYRPPNNAADGLEDNPAGPKPVSLYSAPICGFDAAGGYNWGAVQQSVCPDGVTLNPTNSIYPGVTTCPTGNGCGANIYGIYSVNQNFRAPYIYNYNLQIEKSLGNAAIFQIGYVGMESHKLSVMQNINQVPLADANLSTAAQQAARPFYSEYPNFGDINQLNSVGDANYNSLQTTLKLRSWHGLTSQVAYTWGHELDFVSEYRGVIPLDSMDLKAEYGNGDYDVRNSFSASFVYAVPKAPWATSSWSSKIFNDWQLSSLWVLHGGEPFNITGDTSRPGLDLIANPFVGVSHTFSQAAGGEQWVNPAAFCVPGAAGCTGPTDPLGDLTRNKYYGPGFKDIDFSIIKNIPLTERVSLQLRGEIYNLFNSINLASGSGAVGPSGYITDTIGDFNGAPGIGPGEPRNAQLVAKIIF